MGLIVDQAITINAEKQTLPDPNRMWMEEDLVLALLGMAACSRGVINPQRLVGLDKEAHRRVNAGFVPVASRSSRSRIEGDSKKRNQIRQLKAQR